MLNKRSSMVAAAILASSVAVAGMAPIAAVADSSAPDQMDDVAVAELITGAETIAVGAATPADAAVPIIRAEGDAAAVSLESSDVQVTLGSASDAVVSESGQYALVDDSSVTYAVSYPGEGSTRFSAVLDAPTAVAPNWTFDSGTDLLLLDDGSVSVSSGDQFLGGIDAPWAVDANGSSLPTHYVISGTTLTQIVDTTGAAFPVVADPTVNFYGPYIQVHLNRHESITAVSGYAACAAILSKSPVPFAKALQIACGAVTAIGSAQLVAGKCISIHYVVGVGGPAGVWWPWVRDC